MQSCGHVGYGQWVQIRLMVDDGNELASLRSWLADEPLVRTYGRLAEVPAPAPEGAMSSLAALALVVGSGLSVAELVTIVLIWRAGRPKPVVLHVHAGDRSVEIGVDDVRDIKAIAEMLEANLTDKPEAG